MSSRERFSKSDLDHAGTDGNNHRTRPAILRLSLQCQNLASQGVLEIRRGLGTFVLSPRIEVEITKLTGIVEDMKSVWRRATARVVSHGVVAA